MLKVDESTILYNIEVLDLNSIDKQVLVKVIHLLNKNLMIVIIDNSGVKMMMHLMKKLFKFKEIKQTKTNISLSDFKEARAEVDAAGMPNFSHDEKSSLGIQGIDKSSLNDSSSESSDDSPKSSQSNASQFVRYLSAKRTQDKNKQF